MKRVILAVTLGLALAGAASSANAAILFQTDSIGPIRDVTADWQHYQPASAFCIRPDGPQYTPGGTGATATGADPACRLSGFDQSATGLVKVAIQTPSLCAGCRRLFIDFSHIPSPGGARGHAYYHLNSFNFTYTVGPTAHSPNTKNFTNDKFLTPDRSLQAPLIAAFDTHAIAYVTDPAFFIHNAIQGPYYIGPWYVNSQGERINGVYLDLDAKTSFGSKLLNQIGYVDGFNSGRLCPSDADFFYVGCVDAMGFSASTVDPFS